MLLSGTICNSCVITLPNLVVMLFYLVYFMSIIVIKCVMFYENFVCNVISGARLIFLIETCHFHSCIWHLEGALNIRSRVVPHLLASYDDTNCIFCISWSFRFL